MSRLQFTIKARQARWLNDGRDELGPQYFNNRDIKVFAATEADAMVKAEEIYGHKDSRSTTNSDEPWVEMDIVSFEEKQ